MRTKDLFLQQNSACREHLGTYTSDAEKLFTFELKSLWLFFDDKVARERGNALMDKYESRYPQAIKFLEECLEDTYVFYSYPELDKRKIPSSNMIERLNHEIWQRTIVVEIFPNESRYVCLMTTYLMEYSEDWLTIRAYINGGVNISLVTKGRCVIILA